MIKSTVDYGERFFRNDSVSSEDVSRHTTDFVSTTHLFIIILIFSHNFFIFTIMLFQIFGDVCSTLVFVIVELVLFLFLN